MSQTRNPRYDGFDSFVNKKQWKTTKFTEFIGLMVLVLLL